MIYFGNQGLTHCAGDHFTLRDLAFSSLQGQTFFYHCTQTGSHAYLSRFVWVPDALLPSVKSPECEAEHTVSASAEIKNTWGLSPPSQV
jgi:hypothetical protein